MNVVLKQSVHSSQQDVATAVNTILDDYCKAENMALAQTGRFQLWEELRRYIAGGGKRTRPFLVVMAYEACGGTNPQPILKVAAGWELLHACLLIHDDIMDNDYSRHGLPNVAGAFRKTYEATNTPEQAKHLANSVALITGDMALSGAYQLVLSSGFDSPAMLLATNRLGRVINTVAIGQYLDVEAATQPHGTVDVATVNQYKTAEYSFVGPLCAGAELAGASAQTLQLLTELGTALGNGYQLADDMLSIFGDEQLTGKPVASDLREGKRTMLIQTTYQHCSPDDRQQLEQLMGRQLSAAEIDSVKNIIIRSGAKDKVQACIDNYAEQASTIVDRLAWDKQYIDQLHNFAYKVLNRSA